MSGFVVAMQVGMWFGYVTFGFVSDRFGRKPTYVAYLIVASVLRAGVYGLTRSPIALLLLGPFVAFFGTGYFSGFGAITAEIYPDGDSRHRAGLHLQHRPARQRGRAAFVVGTLAQTSGFGARLHDDGGRVSGRGRLLVVHPGNPRAAAGRELRPQARHLAEVNFSDAAIARVHGGGRSRHGRGLCRRADAREEGSPGRSGAAAGASRSGAAEDHHAADSQPGLHAGAADRSSTGGL